LVRIMSYQRLRYFFESRGETGSNVSGIICPHRLENRCVLRHISNIKIQSWAVGAAEREKKIQTAISMLLLSAVFFYVFMGKKYRFLFKYPSICTEKLHIQLRKLLRNFEENN
jgi:hypothetical protein